MLVFLLKIILAIVLIAIIIFVPCYFVMRRKQKHELDIIESFKNLNPKQIFAIAKYRKATKQKSDNKLNRFLDYIKMLLTLF